MAMADRISRLPDEVVCHILSFLTTEEAVATSVLSKRWRPLWLSIPTLDFDDDLYLKGKESRSSSSFINFVYAIILSRGLNQPIKNLTLVLTAAEKYPYSDVKVWLNAAIQRKLENLKIMCQVSLPCCILTCKTLVYLNLLFVKFDAFSSVHLPLLETLHLYRVNFLNPQYLMDLLYGCPLLEDLRLLRIPSKESLQGLDIDHKLLTSKLLRVVVLNCDTLHIPLKAFSNVKFLTIDKLDVDIPVFPNLIYLDLPFWGTVKWSLALNMLKHCPKLQTIIFNLFGDNDDDWPDPGFVPECFYSHLDKCYIKNFDGVERQMRFAKYVMQNSTRLRTMIIYCRWDLDDDENLEVLTELALCPRSSAGCDLLFQ